MNQSKHFVEIVADMLFDDGDKVGELLQVDLLTVRLSYTNDAQESGEDLASVGEADIDGGKAHLGEK